MPKHVKNLLYAAIIIVGVGVVFKQYFVEQYMRFKLRNEYIVVSFTTTPHRINRISTTLKTILDQNVTVDRIFLSVPHLFKRDNLAYEIPQNLLVNKKLTILRTDDYGPGTKLLGVLGNVALPPSAIIITLDDDAYYPKNLILHLAYKAMKKPDHAVGLSGGDINYTANGEMNPESKLGIDRKEFHENKVAVLLGYAGIAYRIGFFGKDAFDLADASFGCFNGDDFYFSHYLARYNIPQMNVRNEFIKTMDIDWINEISKGKDAIHQISTIGDNYRDCYKFLSEKYPDVKF